MCRKDFIKKSHYKLKNPSDGNNEIFRHKICRCTKMWLWFNLMWDYIKVIYSICTDNVNIFKIIPSSFHFCKKEEKKKDLIKSFTVNVVINFRPHAIKWLLPAQKFDEKVIAYNYTLWVFYLSLFLSWNYPALRLFYMVKRRRERVRMKETGGIKRKKSISLSLTGLNVFSRLIYAMSLSIMHTYSFENVWNEHRRRRHAMHASQHILSHIHTRF